SSRRPPPGASSLPLPDALPSCAEQRADRLGRAAAVEQVATFHRQVGEHRAGRNALQALDADVGDGEGFVVLGLGRPGEGGGEGEDRKSTRLNSSHVKSSYAVLC